MDSLIKQLLLSDQFQRLVNAADATQTESSSIDSTVPGADRLLQRAEETQLLAGALRAIKALEAKQEDLMKMVADFQENSRANKRRRSSQINTNGTKSRLSLAVEDVGVIKWAAVGAASSIGIQSGKISSLQEQQNLLCHKLNETIPAIFGRLDQTDGRLDELIYQWNEEDEADDNVVMN